IPIDVMEATFKIGNPRAYNMIVLGALLEAMEYKLPMENVAKGLKKSLPERHHHLIPLNRDAIEIGRSLISSEN
ncbi:MAG: 2-oxoacid:acceptor oxidoreductase family protein, partial [Muribaculaceae bacterium]|nr:2-oxoacid:acceptor oxidoreductase family protein [Muribaculaceae bacterium]